MLQFAIPEKFLFFPYKTKKTREIIHRLHCGGIKPAKLKKNEVLPLLRSNNSHEAANKFFPKTSRLDDHFRTIRRKDTYGRVVLDDEKGLVQRKRKTRDSNKGILLKIGILPSWSAFLLLIKPPIIKGVLFNTLT